MRNKTLYVIGNGFDQHHNLKSSYCEYHKYVCKNSPDIEEFLNQYFIFKCEQSREDGAYWWTDFESDLASFDAQQFYSDHDNVSEGFMDQEYPQWSDYFGVLDEVIEETEKYILEIKESFQDWIDQLSQTEITQRNMHFDENAIFLSFNYTPTLEKVYHIPNVFHIHGYVGDYKDELIFGHGLEKSKGEILEVNKNGENNRTPSFDAEAASHSIFYQLQKPVKDIIDRNQSFFDSLKCIEKVVVLGHSLNDIDMPYIYKIKDSILNGSSWIIVYYNSDDQERAKTVMKKIGLSLEQYELLSWTDYEKS